jgi:hypothetical protein
MIGRMRNASGCGRDSHRMKVIYPERRRERRYVTLKSAGIAGVAVVVAFLLLSVWSAYRPDSAASENSISSHVQTSDLTSTRPDPMVVNEGWIDDHPGTDSLLLDAGAVSQQQAAAFAAQAPQAAVEETNFEHRTSQLGKGQRITISGGSEAVQLHAEPMPTAAPAPQSQRPLPPR